MKINVKGCIVPSDDGWIYDWLGYENCTPQSVNKALAEASGEDVDVYINSEGGDIFAGSEIYEALRTYRGNCTIHIVGLAASAASVIACARSSEIAPTGMMMVHNVSGNSCGDYHSMDKTSDILRKANQTIATAYTAKTGMSEAEALEMMDKETWLTAYDAVEKKLVDRISEPSVQLTAQSSGGLLSREAIEKIRNQLKKPHSQEKADKNIYQAQLEILKLGGIRI